MGHTLLSAGINFSSNHPSLVWKNGSHRSLHNAVIHIFLVPICVQTSPPCSVLCSKKWVWTIARILNLVRIWIENSRLTIFAFTLWFEFFDAIYSFIIFYVATHFPVISLKPFSCSIISSAPYSFNDFWGLYLIWTQMCQRKCLAFGDIERIGRTLVNRFVNFWKYQQKTFTAGCEILKLLDLLDTTIKDLFRSVKLKLVVLTPKGRVKCKKMLSTAWTRPCDQIGPPGWSAGSRILCFVKFSNVVFDLHQ